MIFRDISHFDDVIVFVSTDGLLHIDSIVFGGSLVGWFVFGHVFHVDTDVNVVSDTTAAVAGGRGCGLIGIMVIVVDLQQSQTLVQVINTTVTATVAAATDE